MREYLLAVTCRLIKGIHKGRKSRKAFNRLHSQDSLQFLANLIERKRERETRRWRSFDARGSAATPFSRRMIIQKVPALITIRFVPLSRFRILTSPRLWDVYNYNFIFRFALVYKIWSQTQNRVNWKVVSINRKLHCDFEFNSVKRLGRVLVRLLVILSVEMRLSDSLFLLRIC